MKPRSRLIPSYMQSRGTTTTHVVAGERLVFVHPIDYIVAQHPDDLIEQLEQVLAWLVQDAIRKFDARTRFREATR